MKFSMLNTIVTEEAHRLKESAAYSGAWNDGGSASLLAKFNDYKNKFIIKYDLKPSEFYKLDDIEVGEPSEFSNIINKYKMRLINNIKL